MKYIVVFTILMSSLVCNSQISRSDTTTMLRLNAGDFSNEVRKDFSLLDRIYLISKTINPKSFVVPFQDSLLIQFDLPEWIKLNDSALFQYAKTYFDALTIALNKDSVKYKWIGVQVCDDPQHCGTAWYDVSKLTYMSKLTLNKKMAFFMQTNFWNVDYFETNIHDGKTSLVLYYFIDSSLKYAQRDYIESYYQSVACVIGDLLQKSPQKIKKKYEDLIILFCSNGNLAYYWRFPLNSKQMAKVYKMKFFEHTRHLYDYRKK